MIFCAKIRVSFYAGYFYLPIVYHISMCSLYWRLAVYYEFLICCIFFCISFYAEDGNFWCEYVKYVEKCATKNYKIQFAKSFNIQQIYWNTIWHRNENRKWDANGKKHHHIAMQWCVVFRIVLLAPQKTKTKPQTTGKKSFLIFRARCACVGKKYVGYMNLSWKLECFEFKWKL